MPLPHWNPHTLGCVSRDGASIDSLLRTVFSSSLPQPMVTRKADTQAPLELSYAIDQSAAQFTAWSQWCVFDLHDGALPFTIDLPWGPEVIRMRARLLGPWDSSHDDTTRWLTTGVMEIERESLPQWSGGAGDWANAAPPPFTAAIVSPSELTYTTSTTSVTTAAATVLTAGGSGVFSYAWAWESGGAGLEILAPTSASTSFRATGVAPGTLRTGVARCTVTDAATGTVIVSTPVTVTIQRHALITATASPASLTYETTSAELTTSAASVTSGGGSGVYAYLWEWASGGAGLDILAPTNSVTAFRASALLPGQVRTGQARCRVTDTTTGVNVNSNTISVSISRTATSVSVAPAEVSGLCSRGPAPGTCIATTAPQAVVSVANGVGPFDYLWELVSGVGHNPVAPTAPNTAFTRNASATSPANVQDSYFRCKVTDTGAAGAVFYTSAVRVRTVHFLAL